MSKASPMASAGARYERHAMRAFLRRFKAKSKEPASTFVVQQILDWVLKRSKRYDARPGGLGRK